MDKKFVITNNPESAALLIKMGLHLVNENGSQWIFLNDNKLVFQNVENLAFTNNLFI